MADRVMSGDLVAVLRAEDFYTPPASQPADAWQLKRPAERVISWYEHKQQRRLPRPAAVLLGEARYARIDAGRWVADCPCGSAQVVSPDDPRMFCVECLTGWHAVTFPADPAAAELAVAELPAHRRFWWNPDDTTSWNRPQPELTDKQRTLALPPAEPDPEGV
jgi:hypothetical protein